MLCPLDASLGDSTKPRPSQSAKVPAFTGEYAGCPSKQRSEYPAVSNPEDWAVAVVLVSMALDSKSPRPPRPEATSGAWNGKVIPPPFVYDAQAASFNAVAVKPEASLDAGAVKLEASFNAVAVKPEGSFHDGAAKPEASLDAGAVKREASFHEGAAKLEASLDAGAVKPEASFHEGAAKPEASLDAGAVKLAGAGAGCLSTSTGLSATRLGMLLSFKAG